MPKPSFRNVFAAVAVLSSLIAPGYAAPAERERKADIGFFEIDKDITLRRMVVHNPTTERDRSLPAWVSGDPVRLEGHFPGPRR